MIATKHNPKDCEVCAAQIEADEIGATPTAGHVPSVLDDIAAKLALSIRFGGKDQTSLKDLLLQFAEEIKRQAIEP